MRRTRTSARTPRRRNPLRRRTVRIPDPVQPTDALFLALRKLRAPLITVVAVFSVGVTGLTLIPGTDPAGRPWHMSVFDALYLMSFTATTIGFGEIPYPLSYPQRAWVIVCIFASVIGWAYFIGITLGLLQDRAFRLALARQSFVRKVTSLRRPFLIVAGYGQMGQMVAEKLDARGRSCVILDADPASLDALANAQLSSDIPALVADARDPASLGLAGLGSPYCAGVLALTHDDEVNLAIVMAVSLLRDDVPVIACANDRLTVGAMHDFGADAVVNAFERYGNYLVMRLRHPDTYRLVMWLTAMSGEPLPPDTEEHEDGHWVIASNDHFGRELAQDLDDGGLNWSLVRPEDGPPDVSGSVGFVAGSDQDAVNLALAGHARLQSPDIFVVVRQSSSRAKPLLEAMVPDSVFIPAQLSVSEALSRVITPDFWEFVSYLWTLDDKAADSLLSRIVQRMGRGSPDSDRFVIDDVQAPAVARWLHAGHPLRLGDLFRHPDDRSIPLRALPVTLIRGGETTFEPAFETPLRLGDTVVLIGQTSAFATMTAGLIYDHVVAYLASGIQVPATWVGRLLARGRRTELLAWQSGQH